MVIETEKFPRLVVHCLRCRQPIPLPAALLGREESVEESELRSHIFLLRCEGCRKEGLYLLKDVVDASPKFAPGI